MALKALLFDLDGTLADTDPIHFQTWKELLQEYDFEIDHDFYRSHFSGRLNQDIVRDFLPQLSEAEGRAVSDRKEAEFRERGDALKPLDGLLELLDWSDQSGISYAVVTNAPPENARFMLRALNLEARMSVLIIAEELPCGKPDPLPYQTALERLGVMASEAIAFEDSPSGIRSAVGADLFTVGVATTQPPEKLLQLGASMIISDFTDAALQQRLQQGLQILV